MPRPQLPVCFGFTIDEFKNCKVGLHEIKNVKIGLYEF